MSTPSLQSLERGLAILQALNRAPGMGIDSLASLLHITRGTIYRLLETLRRDGYVERAGGRGKYVVTGQVLRLSDGCHTAGYPPEKVQPILDDLSTRYRWPVAISTPDGTDMVLRMTTDDMTPFVKRRYRIGSRRPMLTSASGKVFFAYCDPIQRSMILAALGKIPANMESLRQERGNELTRTMDRIRADGCAVHENDENVTTLAVPIFRRKKIAGGLLIRYFSSTMNVGVAREWLLPGLNEAAEQISLLAGRNHNY